MFSNLFISLSIILLKKFEILNVSYYSADKPDPDMSVNGYWRQHPSDSESRPSSDGPSSGRVLSQGYTRSFSSRNP